MSDLSKELDRFAASKLAPSPSRTFIKLTMRASDIETWLDADDIVGVEQMDGWTRLRRRHIDATWHVTERATTVLSMIGVTVVERVPEV